MSESDGRLYQAGFFLTWVVSFIATWAYCAFECGFLLGFGLGWLPASILATILAALWPILLFGGILLALYISKQSSTI